MRKLLLIFAVAAISAVAQEHSAAPPEAGAEGKHGEAAHEEAMPNEIWWKWANFGILAVGLGWLVSKYAGPYFRSRGTAIQEGITEAHKVKVEAEARAAAIEAKISNLSGDVEALRKSSRDEITAEGQRVKAETEQHLAKIQAQAEADIASAAKTASLELKAQAADLALKLAEEQIKARLGAREQAGLLQAFVTDLDGKGKGSQN